MAKQEKIEGAQFVQFYGPVLEQFCQRMLREAGFSQVAVTGRSTDHGIDGHGTLTLNPLVSFKVLFQCKRYKDTVSPAQVRDFRGAMAGRADKGIIVAVRAFEVDAAFFRSFAS